MTEWTSISVTKEQKAELEAAQEQAGRDGAIGRFLVQAVDGSIDTHESVEIDTEAVVDELVAQLPQNDTQDLSDLKRDVQEVLEAVKAANATDTGELKDKINRLESAVKEATNTVQSLETQLEGMR